MNDREAFFEHERYAVVGHSSEASFPRLTYAALKEAGKQVFAVDPSAEAIEGDPVWRDLASLPSPVDGAVLEVPREETAGWVERAAQAGIPRVWIHQNRETEEALACARTNHLETHVGSCAVMYLAQGVNVHTLHKAVWKLVGRY